MTKTSIERSGLAASFRLNGLFAGFAVSAWLLAAPAAPARAQMTPALQMALGNPDGAKPQSGSREHFLISRPQYAESYNDTNRFPNWVAWHLSRQDIGSTERGKFMADNSLPATFTVVTPSDYTRSRYDRGHNCNSKDRSDSRTDNDAVFLMSNMTPQAHGMNAGPWEKLEEYCRDLTGNGSEMFIYCGHGFSTATHPTIGVDKVAVPDYGWKIVVVVPPGSGSAVSRITPTTRVIAVRMPNIHTISNKDWREFRTSVGDIEKATGYHFFDALPAATAAALKNRVDFDQSAPSHLRTPPGGSVPATPAASSTKTTPPPPANAAGTVWVNTRSGAYWRPGTEYYGKTKQGKYMSEADALKAGYHAAGGQ